MTIEQRAAEALRKIDWTGDVSERNKAILAAALRSLIEDAGDDLHDLAGKWRASADLLRKKGTPEDALRHHHYAISLETASYRVRSHARVKPAKKKNPIPPFVGKSEDE